MKPLLLILCLSLTGCCTFRWCPPKETCLARCIRLCKPCERIAVVREIDGRLHALIDTGDTLIDPWTKQEYRRPCQVLVEFTKKDLER